MNARGYQIRFLGDGGIYRMSATTIAAIKILSDFSDFLVYKGRMLKHSVLLPLVLLLLMTGCKASEDVPADIEPMTCGEVKNMHRIGDLYVAGAVSPSDYYLLKAMGIRSIFSLRYDKETPEVDDAKRAEAQGMTFIHLPWSGADELTDDKLDEMRQVLREAERPMLFHCGSANRVGAGWLAYRVLDDGVDIRTALDETKAFGLRTPAYETITLDYIARRQNE